MTDFVLVDSPLVGPSTWSWVADELRALGHGVTVPTTGDAAGAGWQAFVAAVVSTLVEGDEAVLVGHSGADLLLPAVADSLPGGSTGSSPRGRRGSATPAWRRWSRMPTDGPPCSPTSRGSHLDIVTKPAAIAAAIVALGAVT